MHIKKIVIPDNKWNRGHCTSGDISKEITFKGPKPGEPVTQGQTGKYQGSTGFFYDLGDINPNT